MNIPLSEEAKAELLQHEGAEAMRDFVAEVIPGLRKVVEEAEEWAEMEDGLEKTKEGFIKFIILNLQMSGLGQQTRTIIDRMQRRTKETQ